MRAGVRIVGAACFLVAVALLASAAPRVVRDSGEMTRSAMPLGRDTRSLNPVPALPACLSRPPCREVLVQAWGGSLRLHAAVLRVAAALLGCWIVCAWLSRRGLPPARSPAAAARYALARELRRLRARGGDACLPLGYLPPPLLIRRLFGVPRLRALARTFTGSQVCLPAEDLARHVLIVGLTGSHKTTGVTFPVLLEAARRGVSVVALDLTNAPQYNPAGS